MAARQSHLEERHQESALADESSHPTGRRDVRKRPCKGKRDRFKKYVVKVMQQVDSGTVLGITELNIPPCIAANEVLKQKFVARISQYAEQRPFQFIEGIVTMGATIHL